MVGEVRIVRYFISKNQKNLLATVVKGLFEFCGRDNMECNTVARKRELMTESY